MDERLRDLERSALADPTDHTAAWSLVRALDQAGDKVGGWVWRCRLARRGDARAWLELEPPRRSVRAIGSTVRLTDEARSFICGADSQNVVLSEMRGIKVIDSTTLAMRWAQDGRRQPTLCGPFVVAATKDEVVAWETATGREAGRSTLPAGSSGWTPWGTTADRVALATLGAGPLVVVDAGSRPGSIHAWHAEANSGRATTFIARGLRLDIAEEGTSAAWDLETNQRRTGVLEGIAVAADAEGAIFIPFARAERRGQQSWLTLVELATLSPRYRVPVTRPFLAALTPQRIALLGRGGVTVLDRATGATRCSAPIDPDWEINSTIGFACAQDVAYLLGGRAHAEYRRRPEFADVTLVALDLDDGRELWRLPLDIAGMVRLAVLDGAVIASVADTDRTLLVRVQ